MKVVIFLIFLMSMVTSTSCKYEDGSKLSLRSKQHRIVNTWHLEKVIEDNADKTEKYKNDIWKNYQLNLMDNMTYELKFYYSFNSTDYKETGQWAISSDKLYINFIPDDLTMGFYKWEILRLKETEVWVIQSRNGKTLELHLK